MLLKLNVTFVRCRRVIRGVSPLAHTWYTANQVPPSIINRVEWLISTRYNRNTLTRQLGDVSQRNFGSLTCAVHTVLGLLSHSEFTTFEPEKLVQRSKRLSEPWRFMQIMIYQRVEEEKKSSGCFSGIPHLPTSWVSSVNLCTFCEQKLWFVFTSVNHPPVAALVFLASLSWSHADTYWLFTLVPHVTERDWHTRDMLTPPNLFCLFLFSFSLFLHRLLFLRGWKAAFFSQEKTNHLQQQLDFERAHVLIVTCLSHWLRWFPKSWSAVRILLTRI